MAHIGKSSSDPSPLSSQDASVNRGVEEVEAFEQMSPLLMVEDGHNVQEIFSEPSSVAGFQG